MDNNKLLILYHSGAGSTKTLSEIYFEKLNSYFVDINSIDLEYDYTKLENYDFLIFAFPTYHCSPSPSMMEFINNMPVFNEPKKAFAFTTYGLYSGNTLREFINTCSSKNININGYSGYRAPATDGALLLPPVSFMFSYEKNITTKIMADIKKIDAIIKSDANTVKCPSFKLYTILNYPNKILGKAHKHKLKLLKENCVNCNKCVNDCIRKCWTKIGVYPQFKVDNCEFCFKCIHHCPNGAIVLSEKTQKKIKLNEKFYSKLKEKI
ncbi:EFR1 family ferrodoxin [Clostridium vincentii]|uniref:Flavodoxin n=1 Tax=Clostridium vincentii TaxID=52704 RepID=A0A2T0BAY3_9CLOT|nr:EFR1 family ferrodoxin [Clostridium vincentii]PRR81051.1 flavodoxin [Clostridium vincentii]